MVSFISFADTKYITTLNRIHEQALDINIFKNVYTFTEEELGQFYYHNKDFIESNPRGYGYWIWKPYVIYNVLRQLPIGDVLVYCDAGCSINIEGKARLMEYIEMAKMHKPGIVCFEIDRLEKHFTKTEVLERMNYTDVNTLQICSGIMIMHNTEEVREIIKQWLAIGEEENHFYFTDARSKPVPDDFIEHRHDQSVFSILCKQNKCKILKDETYWPNEWDTKLHYPIHANRYKF